MPIETIGLKVESSGVATAIDRLDDFAASGKKAEVAADSLGKKATEASAKVKELGGSAGTASQAVQKVGTATAGAANNGAAFIKGLNDQIRLFGLSSAEALKYEAAQLGLSTTSYLPLIAQLESLRQAQDEATVSAMRQMAINESIKASLQAVDSARYSLIEGLREEIALFGLSASEATQYQARLLGISGSVDPLVQELNQLKAAQAAVNAEQQKATANAGFISSLRDQAETYGLTTSEVLEYRAAQQGLSAEAGPYIKRIRDQEAAVNALNSAQARGGITLNKYGQTAGQTAQAFRVLPAQITDIVTSLISGQPAYLVAIQQGGQLKDSFGGIVPAARALLGAITPLAIGVSAIAAGIGILFYGIKQGQAEQEEFTRSLILTGGVAGVTAGELGRMAGAIDQIAGTRANAAEVLNLLVSTGQVGSDSLERFATTTVQAERVLGTSAEKIAKNFADLGRDPVGGVRKLNDELHFLTLAQFEQIRALADAGRATEAAKLAQDAYADSLRSRTGEMTENIGSIERGWKAVKSAVAEAAEAVLSFGQLTPPEVRLAQLQADRGSRPLGTVTAQAGNAFIQSITGDRDPRQIQIEADAEERRLQATVDQNKAQAESIAINRRAQDEAIAAADALQKIREAALPKSGELQKALREYEQLAAKLAAAGSPISAQQQATDKKSIIERIVGPVSTVDSQVSAVQRALDTLTGSYANAEAIIEAQRSSRNISDELYYAVRVNLIQQEAAAQVQALQQQNDIINKEVALGQKRIDNQNKVAENTARIAMISADASAQVTVLGIQQKDATDRIAIGFRQSQAAAQDYLETLRRGYQRQLDDFGQGPAARRYSAGRNQIDDRTSQQRFQLEGQRASGQITGDQYSVQLESLKTFQTQALADWDDYFNRIEARNADFSLGFNDALLTYIDSIRNVGSALGNDLVGAFAQAQAAGADLAAGALLWGEGGSEAAKQIARDLLTQTVSAFIQAGVKAAAFYALQQAGIVTTAAVSTAAQAETTAVSVASSAAIAAAAAPAAALVSLGSFGSNAIPAAVGIALISGAIGALLGGAFANGGDPPVGRVSLVGEKGPELFIPRGQGTIIPAGQTAAMLAGGRGGSIAVNVINNGRPASATVTSADDGNGGLTLEVVMDEVDGRLNDNTSRTSRILSRRTGIRSPGSIG